MRETIFRVTAPLVAWLPDLREVPFRRQMAWAIGISCVLHLLVFCGMGIFSMLLPERKIDFARSKPKPRDLEVEIMPAPEPPPPPPPSLSLAPPEREYIDSTGLKKSDKPAEKPLFESDQDMVAASENPATGNLPLPSQQGITGQPFTNFTTQDVRLGMLNKPVNSQPSEPPSRPQPAPKEATIPKLTPAPKREEEPPPPPKPTPVPATPEPAKPEEKEREPATPAPMREAATNPDRDELPIIPKPVPTPTPRMVVTKLVTPPPRPEPVAIATPTPKPEQVEPPPSEESLTPPAPPPEPPSEGGFQPQQRQTKIDGAISNKGKAGVDSVKTPLGAYVKHVTDYISGRWHQYVAHNELVTIGTLHATFFVDKKGTIKSFKVNSNTSNDAFANICEMAIRDGVKDATTDLGAPPPDVIALMKEGRLEFPVSFTYYEMPK